MGKAVSVFVVVLFLGIPCSCDKKQGVEEKANVFLKYSRSALQAEDFVKAKAYIDTIRSQYPKALNAREEGILLLDSINIKESQKELEDMERKLGEIVNPTPVQKDTLDFYYDEAKEKVRFFKRKLQNDLQNKKVH